MGTINYKTSDYITLGIRPYDFDDVKAGLIELYQETDQDPEDITNEEVYDQMSFDYECDYENAKAIIDKYDLYYFHVTIEPGYYEGLSINIENNFPVFYDDYREKADAQKEVAQLKALLTDLAGCGFQQCFPGWITSFRDYKETLTGIREAIREVRAEIKATPTYRQYVA